MTERHLPSADRLALLSVVTRGSHAECWHFGAAAVATPQGRLVAAAGDPGLRSFLRSAAKPLQALPLTLAGGVERFGLEDPDLAVICGSHAGTEAHVERVGALLRRAGLSAGDLLCGVHPPLDPATVRRLAATGRPPGPLHNNCSGNHAGMLLACRQLELPTADYLEPEHPLQRRILEEVARFSGVEAREIEVAVDGCGAPAYRLPLAAAARAWAGLADPKGAGLDAARCRAARRLMEAMAGAPDLVAGPGRFTTSLIEATGGRVIGKEGADGFYCAAIRGPVALGLAVKIGDGGEAGRPGVVLELLRQTGSLSGDEARRLAAFHRRPVRTHRGRVVGEIAPRVELIEPGPGL